MLSHHHTQLQLQDSQPLLLSSLKSSEHFSLTLQANHFFKPLPTIKMKASVVTLALFGAAAIANPVAVEKREIEPRALNLVPALTNIPGAAGLGTLGNIAVITTILNAADAFAAFATLSQTIQNTIATLRAGVPGNALAPVTAITGVTGNPVSAIPAGTTLTPEQILALATSLQYQLGNLTLLTSNLPTGGLLGGGLSATQLGSIQNALGVLQGALTPVLNPTGLLSNVGSKPRRCRRRHRRRLQHFAAPEPARRYPQPHRRRHRPPRPPRRSWRSRWRQQRWSPRRWHRPLS
ncbi:hypothetical protein CCHR01_09139 [Colletotrichum chrysophilum]|uniref:Uncharacterized protein n=1 Tax=Colletotrichum chrysophilum TaxID=1836956 RepID=A0AAD9EEF5_9PEZI|nr:hypothetical protein CCHR01_09139 [Colletotrichum chrysophilum]